MHIKEASQSIQVALHMIKLHNLILLSISAL